MASRHIPPSRRRYEAANPTVTTRISGDLLAVLTDIAEAEAKSLGEVIRDALIAYVEPDPSESEEDEEPEHGPEAHPEHLELKAEVERLKSERMQLRLDSDYAQRQVRDLAGWKAKAERAQATLTQIGGPLGMYVRCIHCSHEWHEHKWVGAHRSWLCPRD